jgi:hypothetical protein
MRSDVGTRCIQLIAAWLTASAAALGQVGSPPTLSVNISSERHPINAQVYGIANYGLDATYAKEISVPNIRWGGDGTTRYNWEVDSSNAGFDWYFMGGSGTANPTPGASADQMIRTYQPANALITIPIIPFVNKSAAWSCSFPVSIYGAQQSTNPYVHPNGDNCGNSIASNGTQLVDNNIYANHIDNSTGLQKGWLQHLVGTFGPASQGGVLFYQLDNEPAGWSNTHRDVLPNGADYPTITQLGEQYAAAVKQVDSSAMVLGPSDFTLGGWVGDTTKQGGLLAGQYYLQQMAAYQATNGTRILDYFDEHYYFDVSSPTAQLASTRTLWDPTFNGGTWVEQYVFNGPMQLLPRFKGWVSQYYPGTKISLSEYSIDSGSKSVVDAVAEMDVLGIFGREQLDFANMWSAPAPTDPIAYAFRMYRNYDGSGGQYGDTWVAATSSDQSQLSVYAAQRTSDSVVTILILNKTSAPISTTLALTGTTLPTTASVYSYSSANLQKIISGTKAPIDDGAITSSFPGYSATLFTFTPAAAPLAVTTTAVAASPTTLTTGQTVTLTAIVSGSGSPAGIVAFKDGGSTIGSVTLSGGNASFSTSALGVGSHTITAVYAGDSGDASSTSSPVIVTVTQPAPLSTSTALSVTSSQITVGQKVVLTAIVSGSGSPTGTVSFNDGGTTLASVAITNGSATFIDSNLAAGTHSVLASYSGDANNTASTSQVATIVVVQPPVTPPVVPPPPELSSTTTVLNASSRQLTSSQPLTLTATVSNTASFPSGTVTFNDATDTLGAVTLTHGVASITTTLSAGIQTIVATYSGDSSNAASVSSPLTINVSVSAPPPAAPQDFLLQLGQTAMTLTPGASGQIGFSIAPQNGFNQQLKLSCSGLPSGAICTFSPAILTPSAGATGSMTISMNSSATLAATLFIPLSGILLFFDQRLRRFRLTVAVAAFTFLVAGCGAGVRQTIGNGASAGPPAGNYTVQVTAASSTGLSHTQPMTLTVQ